MTQQQYSDLASAINQALVTAGITTLTFTAKTNELVNAVTYPNILDFSGYHLQSATLTIQNIISKEMQKYGAFYIVKCPTRVITPPSNPPDDHYQITFGYYLNNNDLPPGQADEIKLNSSLQNIAQNNTDSIKNTIRPLKYSYVSGSSVYTLSSPDMSGNRTVTITSTAVINKPT